MGAGTLLLGRYGGACNELFAFGGVATGPRYRPHTISNSTGRSGTDERKPETGPHLHEEALVDAGCVGRKFDRDRFGVILAAVGGDWAKPT